MTWQPIETAPDGGVSIQAKIPGYGSDNIIAWFGGLVDENGKDCGGWHYMEGEPPDCWTDGVCWTMNADLKASIKPTHWYDNHNHNYRD
jgi:hypothetical protein